MRTVECILEVNPGRAVPCIKAIREATGRGLKEAKDLYDACRAQPERDVGARVRMSAQTYGELMLSHMLDDDWLFCFHSITVVDAEPPYIQL